MPPEQAAPGLLPGAPTRRPSRPSALSLPWLNRERVVLYGGVICALYAAVLLMGLLLLEHGPQRSDFIAFHAAARLAVAGEAAAAYQWDRLQVEQAVILGIERDAIVGYLAWLNPPHFFFAVVPLHGLSYAWAWASWVVICSTVFALAIRAVLPGPAAIIAGFCAPAVLITLVIGQNGLLVAALMAWTLALLDRRPLAAGVALGLLTIKPQFGLILPLVLVATGRWRVILVASGTAILAALASLAAFGPETWLAFAQALPANAQYLLEQHDVGHRRLQSVYAFGLLASGRKDLAWVLHGAFAAAIIVLVLRLWMRRPEGPAEARAAAAIAGTFLVTPYVWIYDMPAIAIAALFLARAAQRDGWLAAEKPLLIAACGLPGLVLVLGTHPLVGPFVWLLVLGSAWRRDRAWRLSPAPRGLPCAGT
jgi:hypothetical protein